MFQIFNLFFAETFSEAAERTHIECHRHQHSAGTDDW